MTYDLAKCGCEIIEFCFVQKPNRDIPVRRGELDSQAAWEIRFRPV